jgi:hypothetical protein
LLGAKRRDPQLLTVSAGLGIYVTAHAIGFGVRQLISKDYGWIPGLFMVLAHLVSVYIWWTAFRPAPKISAAPNAVLTRN